MGSHSEILEALKLLVDVIAFEDDEVQRSINETFPTENRHWHKPIDFAKEAIRKAELGVEEGGSRL